MQEKFLLSPGEIIKTKNEFHLAFFVDFLKIKEKKYSFKLGWTC